MKRWACAVMLVSLALTGCGDSACEDLADSFDAFDEHAQPCDDGSTLPSEPITDEDIQQCDKKLEACSDSDKDTVKEFASCIANVPTCDPGDRDPFSSATLACLSAFRGKISSTCTAVTTPDRIGRQAAWLLTSHD